MSVPALRFPEFEEEWEEKRLGEIATFQRGFDLPSQERNEGTVPIVSSGGITGFHDEAKVEGPGIVTGRYGSIGELFYLKEPHWPLNTALWVKDFHGNSMDFAFYHLSRVDFAKLSDKTGVPGINRNDLHRLWASTTSLPEQQKIAAFLGAVDAKIAALRERRDGLERYKRGLMQALFSQRLRFTKENGSAFPDWEEKRLGEVFKRITRKNEEDNQNVLTISAQQGLVNQREYFNKSVSAQDVSGYYLLKKGDFAYNKSYSKGYPMGAIKRLNNYEKGVVSTLYICFSTKCETAARYFEQFFDFGGMNREIHKIAQEGARNHGLLNMSVVEFFKDIEVPFPHPDEQQKIADALSAMDDKIAAVADQVARMETFKKGLLQQMFV